MVLHVEDVGRMASFGGVLNNLFGQGAGIASMPSSWGRVTLGVVSFMGFIFFA